VNSHGQKVIADDSPREMERVNMKKRRSWQLGDMDPTHMGAWGRSGVSKIQ